PKRIELLFGKTALSHQTLGVALDRVTPFPFPEQIPRHVAHVVVRAVAMHPHGVALDERRPLAGASAIHSNARGLEHGLDVVTVHRNTGKAIALRPPDRIDRILEVGRCGVGELVVLEDEYDRETLDAGEVECLVTLAVGGGALAEVGHRDSRLAPHP